MRNINVKQLSYERLLKMLVEIKNELKKRDSLVGIKTDIQKGNYEKSI